MKFLGFFFLGLFVSFMISCKTSLDRQESNNYILWENSRKLTFKDFKGKANGFGSHIYGYCATQYRFSHTIDKETKLPKFIIKCYFNKKASFIKNKNDTATLRHEQIHFNITELFCRRTRKSWDSLRNLNIKKIGVYNLVRNKNLRNINSLDESFDEDEYIVRIVDKETNKYNDIYYDSVVRKWETKIELELRQLEDYSQ